MTLLSVENLTVRFETPDGTVNAVNDLNFTLDRGQSLAIVGESGSGKSQTVFSLMGLLAANGRATGRAVLDGQNILNLPQRALNKIRPEKWRWCFRIR
jgi:oligopeptide transport system ATP-binding protein